MSSVELMSVSTDRLPAPGSGGAGENPRCFLPADLVGEFSPNFLDRDVCRWWLIAHCHTMPPGCPECKTGLQGGKQLYDFLAARQVRCRECGKRFTAKTGTLLAQLKMPLEKFFLVVLLLGLKVPATETAEILKLNPDTVRIWQRKFQAIESLKIYGGAQTDG